MKERYALSAGPAPAPTGKLSVHQIAYLVSLRDDRVPPDRSHPGTYWSLKKRELVRLDRKGNEIITPAGRRKLKELGK